MHGPEVDAACGLVEKLHGVTQVLAEDGAGRTQPKVGHRLGGALAATKRAPAVWRRLGAEAVAQHRGWLGLR
jgi:hypothetical protein